MMVSGLKGSQVYDRVTAHTLHTKIINVPTQMTHILNDQNINIATDNILPVYPHAV